MKRFVNLLICAVFLSVSLFAQKKDTVNVKGMYSGGSEGELNAAVQTAVAAGKLSSTVFKLNRYDWYVINGTIEVPKGQTLDLFAPPPGNTQETAPPQILWTASTSVSKTFLIDVFGDLIMKNIWIRFATVAGIQTGTPIVFDGDTASVGGGKAQYGTFENCLFEYMPCPAVTAGGSIVIRSKHFDGTFKNCFFRNCTDRHYMYYGRAVSFPYDTPGYHTEKVSFENCTFTNMGYVYMQEANNYADNVSFNHCTFYNIVMWPLEYGWWYKLNVNNCLFVNPYMLGFIPKQNPKFDNSATVCITPVDSIAFKTPFKDKDRHILFTHSAYYMDNWLVDWMRGGWEKNYSNTPWRPDPKISTAGNPYSVAQFKARLFSAIPYPRPMVDSTSLVYFTSTENGAKKYPFINKAWLYDVNVMREQVNPGILTAPTNTDPLKYFLWQKWDANKDSMWAYMPEAGFEHKWPLPENLAFTNAALTKAGMGGFPVGDLYHWWNPTIRAGATDQYSKWLAQADKERTKIATWLDTGANPDSSGSAVETLPGSLIPDALSLQQNYPNPFNPETQIAYSVPATGRVSLKVYNTVGQEVAILFEGIQQAGTHAVSFDGKGISGGIYFYRLQSEGVSITRKFVLMK